MALYPTPTRIALLHTVHAGHVQYGTGPDGVPGNGPRRRQPAAWDISNPHRGPHKVTAAIEEMERAGWVERPDRTAVWKLTDAGQAIIDAASLPGELVCATYSQPGSHELMIRRVPAGAAHDYWLYVNGARAYGPYWRSEDAYDRLKQLGGRP